MFHDAVRPAARLMRALTDPDVRIEIPYDDLPRLSDEELGTLLAEAHAVRPSAPDGTRMLALALEGAARDRRPRYTPEACRRMIEALAARSEDHDRVDLTAGVRALEHRTGPLTEVSGALRTLVASSWRRTPYGSCTR